MFEQNKQGKYVSGHHPFTRPVEENAFELPNSEVFAQAFDLAINGYEVGGGSMRLHEASLQRAASKKLGWTEEEYSSHFKPLL